MFGTWHIFPRIFCVFDSSFTGEQYKKNRGVLAWTISDRAEFQNSWFEGWLLKIFFNRSKMTLNDFFTFFKDRIANFYFLKNDFDWINVFSHFWALNEIMNPQMRVIVYVDKKDYFELDTYILLILFLLRALVNWIIY